MVVFVDRRGVIPTRWIAWKIQPCAFERTPPIIGASGTDIDLFAIVLPYIGDIESSGSRSKLSRYGLRNPYA